MMKSHSCFALLWMVSMASVSQARYAVTVLHPASFSSSHAYGIAGASQVGFADDATANAHALLWNGNASSAVDLNPIGFTSSVAYGAADSGQVGVGVGSATGNSEHALLWNGTPASFVDLNPSGFSVSHAWGIFGASQVGDGSGPSTNNLDHALMWNSTAGSAVDLNPSGFFKSYARAVYGSTQGGYGYRQDISDVHALLWHGTASSVVDLTPSGFLTGYVLAASGSSQAGYGYGTGNGTPVGYHAVVWKGTAASAVDLNPSGFSESYAYGVSDTFQVGNGIGSATGGYRHALVWSGTAASVQDLNPSGFTSSAAYGVASNGYIVGFGVNTLGDSYALLWRQAVTLTGTLTVRNFIGDKSSIVGQMAVFSPGASSPIASARVKFGKDGSFSVTFTGVPAGTYDIRLKTTKTLAKRLASVVLTGDGAAGLNYLLTNGDVDNNNAVNIVDYGFLSTAFNTTKGDAGYDDRADLDGNLAVNILDYAILSDNFNQVGDN